MSVSINMDRSQKTLDRSQDIIKLIQCSQFFTPSHHRTRYLESRTATKRIESRLVPVSTKNFNIKSTFTTNMPSKVRTSVLIISDTHGMDFDLQAGFVDVAIHCGDLTDESKLDEFRATIRCLSRIQSPLKLIIAGNHDFTLDVPSFEKKLSEATPSIDPQLIAKVYGHLGEAEMLFKEARAQGIVLLDEGNHRFTLSNGACLQIYASPYTPSLGAWGFQYPPEQTHNFSINEGTDIVITHGPPKGIMDFTHGRERAGCSQLFAALAQAKPKVHCFGHIHEGWGAKRVTWRETYGITPTHFTAIDNDKSTVIESLLTLNPSKFDSTDDLARKQEKVEKYKEDGFIKTDAQDCAGSSDQAASPQTLFVNAAMAGSYGLSQLPWIVCLDLRANDTGMEL